MALLVYAYLVPSPACLMDAVAARFSIALCTNSPVMAFKI